MIVATLIGVAGVANAQDRCETELSGGSYSCDFTFAGFNDIVVPLTLSFGPPTLAEVLTPFQAAIGGIRYACSCVGKGSPGKLKSSEKATTFTCVEAQVSPATNDEVISGKVSGGGTKIVKGRYFLNATPSGGGGGGGLFDCVKN